MKKSTIKSGAVQLSSNFQMWFVGAATMSLLIHIYNPVSFLLVSDGYEGLSAFLFSFVITFLPVALFASAFVLGPKYKTLMPRLFVATLAATIGTLVYGAMSSLTRYTIFMMELDNDPMSFWNTSGVEYLLIGVTWSAFTYALYLKWRAK